jgi:hypothetical protein
MAVEILRAKNALKMTRILRGRWAAFALRAEALLRAELHGYGEVHGRGLAI